MSKNPWYKDWFNSKYYHILYKDRNDYEANNFIKNIVDSLQFHTSTRVLDLACGKGRHSVQLKKYYTQVVGVDLSDESIKYAKSNYAEDSLDFFVADMRTYNSDIKYDAIFNLFTSFGYFSDTEDNIKVLSSCYNLLNNKGILVIDFLNALKVKNTFIKEEAKKIDNINFKIKRKIENNCIIKNISFNVGSKEYCFNERVQLITKELFIQLLNKTGFDIVNIFGSYDLEPYIDQHSDRLIIIVQKI